jgi:hypothetical protein
VGQEARGARLADRAVGVLGLRRCTLGAARGAGRHDPSVCKHILESKKIEYNKTSSDLTDLYKLVAKELNLAPEQHQEQIFKQILGGCSSIIGGLSAVRNKLGDAHGKGKNAQKPKARHAEFSINLSGAMAIFLIQTFEESQTK